MSFTSTIKTLNINIWFLLLKPSQSHYWDLVKPQCCSPINSIARVVRYSGHWVFWKDVAFEHNKLWRSVAMNCLYITLQSLWPLIIPNCDGLWTQLDIKLVIYKSASLVTLPITSFKIETCISSQCLVDSKIYERSNIRKNT